MPSGWSAMLMTMFVVGLNAPSLPLLPLFTCASAAEALHKTPIANSATRTFILILIVNPLLGFECNSRKKWNPKVADRSDYWISHRSRLRDLRSFRFKMQEQNKSLWGVFSSWHS